MIKNYSALNTYLLHAEKKITQHNQKRETNGNHTSAC